MAETYLDLARIRFGDRLRVEFDVDDAARNAQVPVLLLQPLIENALRHGVGRVASGGTIGISCARNRNTVTATVWNDGPGLDDGEPRENIGLGNTRERLRHAFGAEFDMTLRPRPTGGAEVVVIMPYRLAVEGEAP
jgi:sensor histidine kinase YesM